MNTRKPRPCVVRLASAFGIMALSFAITPNATLGDCTQLSPWPSFTASASSANRILIGTVTWTPGGAVNSRFTVRVDHVFRGSAPATINLDAFRSGAPQPICPEDSSLVVHDVGDRLAFAYGAHLPGLDRSITSVAFVAPSHPDHFFLPRMETVTVSEVRDLAGLPPTDAVDAAFAVSDSGEGSAVLLVSGLVGAVMAIVLVRRRSTPLING